MLSNWSMPMDSSDHLSHLQVLLSFLTGSRIDLFGCVSIIEALIMFPAMLVLMAKAIIIAISVLMARTVTIAITLSMAMIGLMLQDKLGRVWLFQKKFLLADTSLILGMSFLTLSSTLAEGELV